MCYLRQVVYSVDICSEAEGALSPLRLEPSEVASHDEGPALRQPRRRTHSFWTEWQLSDVDTDSSEAEFPPR
jgi:hypothetical protein